jgi:hypothetical protein
MCIATLELIPETYVFTFISPTQFLSACKPDKEHNNSSLVVVQVWSEAYLQIFGNSKTL